MEEQSLTEMINRETGLSLPVDTNFADIRLRLQEFISALIVGDFQQLVNLLYRVDVNERKLKYLLQENVGEDAAVIIAGLIIDRQLEKIASRREFKNESPLEDDEEKW
jgi:hypothetical protein